MMKDPLDEFIYATGWPAAAPAARGGRGETIDEIELVWEALSGVIDPEIGLDIVTLGLVYDVVLEGPQVRVAFTLTTPGCPMQEAITRGVENAVSSVPGVDRVLAEVVWEPRWHPDMIREGAW